MKDKNSNKQTLDTMVRLNKMYHRMVARCHNENDMYYRDYGSHGITVCYYWRTYQMRFIMWALRNGWRKDLEIDRIDNDKGYCPSNCRFVTHRRNLGNRGHGDGSKGFRGRRYKLPMCVSYDQKSKVKHYTVIVAREGVRKYVGRFATVEEAVAARDIAIKKLEKKMYGKNA